MSGATTQRVAREESIGTRVGHPPVVRHHNRPALSAPPSRRPARVRTAERARTTTRPAFSLIIPAHNEAQRLPETIRTYSRAAEERFGSEIEILVVANGCSDETALVAERLREELPYVHVVDIPESIGKGGAVIEGLRRARGRRVAFADADGATDAASLLSLLDGLDEADVVIGSRRHDSSEITRKQPLLRRVLSRFFNLSVRLLFGLPHRDTQCGAKAFRPDAARRLAEVVHDRLWTFDLDLLLSARRLGLTVAERPVVWSDGHGSRLDVGSTAFDVGVSLARLWLRERLPWLAGPMGFAPLRPAAPRKILAINWRFLEHPEAGGAELNLYEQARRWCRDGCDVTILTARRGQGVELPAEDDVDGMHVRRVGGKFTVYPLVAWYLMWHGHEYDIVLDVANGIPFFSPLFTSTPSVLLVHHVSGRQWFAEFPKPIAAIGAAIERFVVPIVYRRRSAIAVSPTTREAMLETGFSSDRVRVVYNGTTMPSAAEPEDAEPSGPLTIAYVGRLKRYKRLDRLVRAFARLRIEFPEARLEIAGDGDAAAELRAVTDELGLGDAVTLHGFVDDEAKSAVLRRATVFATPSMQEGWGLSVLEANCHGCPAVAYDVPGLRASIQHGETGLLASDDDAFDEAIATLLRDAALRSRMSDAARLWAARFDWETAARETLEILESARARSGTGAVAGAA